MAEVNQVPETAVSPEIVDNFARPPEPEPPVMRAQPYVHPELPVMRAVTPLDEVTHVVDYDAFNQRYRMGTEKNPNLVPGAPQAYDPSIVLGMAAGPARVGGAASRVATALGGKVPASLYRWIGLENRMASQALSPKMEKLASMASRRLGRDLGISPNWFGRFAPGTAPEDIRLLRMAHRTITGLEKPGFVTLMNPQVAKDLVEAEKAYYVAAKPFLSTAASAEGGAVSTASREAMTSAYTALRKQIVSAGEALAAKKSPVGSVASALASDAAKARYGATARFLLGMQHYDKYGRLVHGYRTPVARMSDRAFDAFLRPDSPLRETVHHLGFIPEWAARLGLGYTVYDGFTYPRGRPTTPTADDNSSAADKDLKAYGVESSADTSAQPATVPPAERTMQDVFYF